jgi:lipoic acid synthetase
MTLSIKPPSGQAIALEPKPAAAGNLTRGRRPVWLRVRPADSPKVRELRNLFRGQSLHTVCEEARCPNIGECWNDGHATFMILGDTCTRACGFCAVTSGRPGALDPLEPLRLASAVERMGLDYCVITSVNRDDVADGGAGVFADCIRAVRRVRPSCQVEVLIPDFMGNWDALATVLEARPVVLNHNTETVPRLYARVRPKARYERTLELIRRAASMTPDVATKSGVMVGLGETRDELRATLADLVENRCELLTVGQYLQPTRKHLPVERFYHPDEFVEIAEEARALGFIHVESGPLVRSSYHAGRQALAASMNRARLG